MKSVLNGFARVVAQHLDRPAACNSRFGLSDREFLRAVLVPGDIILIEGNGPISGIIKYLTQSIWSHAALYVGPIAGTRAGDCEPHVLVEANLAEGIVSAPLSKYFSHHTRICRPIGLSASGRDDACRYAIECLGRDYDIKNIIDLLRYLFPLPVPQRWRHRSSPLGSRDPSRIMCSALIAQAFEAAHYPVICNLKVGDGEVRRVMSEISDASFCTPRDFDLSPYFAVVKPLNVEGFHADTVGWGTPLPAASTAGTPIDNGALIESSPSAPPWSRTATSMPGQAA